MKHRLTNNRDLQDLILAVRALGCEVTKRQNGHLRIDTPQGPVFCSSSPSDYRAVFRIKKDLKTKGVEL